MDISGGLWMTLLMALTSDPSDPEHSVHKSAVEAANYYLEIERPEHALEIVDTLLDTEERLDFYRMNGFIDELIEVLLKTNNISEVYRVLKGSNEFEEGAIIAKGFNDVKNHFTFLLLDIKAKLWTCDPAYTEIAKQSEIQKLQLLENKIFYRYSKEQITHCIAVLKNNFEDYKDALDTLYGFIKSITFDAFLKAFKPLNYRLNAIIPILKNLECLLRTYNLLVHQGFINKQIRIFYHIKIIYDDNKADRCIFPPIVLQKLQVNRYEVDMNGNVIVPLAELKESLIKYIKSIAKSWLKILDKLLGKNIHSSGNSFQHCVKAKDMIKTLQYCINLISCKHYFEQFGISYATELDYCVTETMLLNVLSLPWICYVPNDHTTVVALLNVPVIANLFGKLRLVENWAFQGNTDKFFNFKRFTKQTIDRYSIEVLSDQKIASFVSELEIITIGILAIMSKHHYLIIPQSYEIVTDWFDEINDCKFFSTLRKQWEDGFDLLTQFIKILLGDDPFANILARTYIMTHPDHYPICYQFERCFVLALTLLGNLAPLLDDDTKNLFQISLQGIYKVSTAIQAKNTSDPKIFRYLIFEAANATTTDQLFDIIYKIQKLYSRKMMTFNIQNKKKQSFEEVEPKNFPSFPLYPESTTGQNSSKEKLDCFSGELELISKINA